MYNKTIIDKKGYIAIPHILVDENNNILLADLELQDDQEIVEFCKNTTLLKPKWDLEKEGWIEMATDEEIKKWEEANKPVEKEPTKEDLLEQQLLETQAQLVNLKEQILLNNGGIK
ncbi:hypothetical protein [Clostridium sp. ZBS2]|uniref:hypothetical protein n=1 Tax=Clostridium sp. ZBS2 TaxID=2949976 RepID=UPI00207A7FC4|nr:hypothetical protein [Clostridium sp. ZBS2]